MPTKRRNPRKAKQRSQFDIPADSSSDPAEADESSQLFKRKGKRQKSAAPTRAKATTKATTSKPRATKKTAPLQPSHASRSNTTKSPTPASFLGKPTKSDPKRSFAGVGRSGGSPLKTAASTIKNTYGNENEVLVARSDDGLDDTHEVTKSKSPLKDAKSKWKEIDDFELEFEDVSVYERSSERDAR